MACRHALIVVLPVAPVRRPSRTPRWRRAQQAFENLDYRQALTIPRRRCGNGSPGSTRARVTELLGFTYSGLDSILKAVDAFKQVSSSSRSETSIPIVPREGAERFSGRADQISRVPAAARR